MLKNVKIKVSAVFDNDNSIGPKTSYGLPIIHPTTFSEKNINDFIIIISV